MAEQGTPPVPGQYFYDQDLAFRTPQTESYAPDPDRIKVYLDNITELEKQRQQSIDAAWKIRQQAYDAAGRDLANFYQGSADFARAKAEIDAAQVQGATAIDKSLMEAGSRWILMPSDPTALTNPDVLPSIQTQANLAAQALAASGEVQTAEQWLAATASARAEAQKTFNVVSGVDASLQMGTARDISKTYRDTWERTLAGSGLSPEAQAAVVAELNREAQQAYAPLGPGGMQTALELSQKSEQLYAAAHQVNQALDTVPGSHASYPEWRNFYGALMGTLNARDAYLDVQGLYEDAVDPRLNGAIEGLRALVAAETQGQGDRLDLQLAAFQKAHPWFSTWSQAMRFSDSAYAARHLVRYPEQIARLDEMYKADPTVFQRAEDSNEARGQLRQQLRQGMQGPGTSTHPLLRGLTSLAYPIGATPVDETPYGSSQNGYNSAYNRGVAETEAEREPISAPEAPKAPEGTGGAIEAPVAPAAPGGTNAPTAPVAPAAPGGKPPSSSKPPAKSPAKPPAKPPPAYIPAFDAPPTGSKPPPNTPEAQAKPSYLDVGYPSGGWNPY
jgi:hypothetical protein